MGTDIHLYVEIKNKDNGDLEFLPAEGNAPQTDWEKENNHWDWYGGRNYSLFAILANVRNGSGFAGVDTGDGYVPIAMPRGVPEDASPEFAERVWGHSASWLNLKEILEYDWSRTSVRRGFITPLEFAGMSLAEGTSPTGWCGWTNAKQLTLERMQRYITTTHFLKFLEERVRHWKEDVIGDPNRRAEWREHDQERLVELEALLAECRANHAPSRDPLFLEDANYTLQYEWGEPYTQSAGRFIDTTIPLLESLVEDPADLRLVFFFDS